MAPQLLAHRSPASDWSAIGEPSTVPEVLTRLGHLHDRLAEHRPLGEHDGVACCTALYRRATSRMWHASSAGSLRNPELLAGLQVGLANRYLAAAGGEGTACWAPLLAQRDDPRVSRLQFAAAGVTAHLRVDLPLALVDLCLELGTSPFSGAKQDSCREIQRAFVRELLALRRSLEAAWGRLAAQVERGVPAVFDQWTTMAAEETAWGSVARIWELRRRGYDPGPVVDGLAQEAAEAAAEILVPVL